ncbi:GATA-binding transcription factor [Heterostelium album PN500]|uniref:GATA-binding transcription factor n=1 Tax=Heterostelium pallidum (strain ATCC 26659 / Pp 5 / PN500) TaxID=670386 RepID=D3BKA9_HETP5|nr:GATA-binding transcription factor [Heterostelium album PN500]EFA78339.1 GATA-binding transcription factor [Heterostelium album PN500]|eukprot:XP_020430464.1 GATA-binding transcription factor [Heterostelium album PN500]
MNDFNLININIRSKELYQPIEEDLGRDGVVSLVKTYQLIEATVSPYQNVLFALREKLRLNLITAAAAEQDDSNNINHNQSNKKKKNSKKDKDNSKDNNSNYQYYFYIRNKKIEENQTFSDLNINNGDIIESYSNPLLMAMSIFQGYTANKTQKYYKFGVVPALNKIKTDLPYLGDNIELIRQHVPTINYKQLELQFSDYKLFDRNTIDPIGHFIRRCYKLLPEQELENIANTRASINIYGVIPDTPPQLSDTESEASEDATQPDPNSTAILAYTQTDTINKDGSSSTTNQKVYVVGKNKLLDYHFDESKIGKETIENVDDEEEEDIESTQPDYTGYDNNNDNDNNDNNDNSNNNNNSNFDEDIEATQPDTSIDDLDKEDACSTTDENNISVEKDIEKEMELDIQPTQEDDQSTQEDDQSTQEDDKQQPDSYIQSGTVTPTKSINSNNSDSGISNRPITPVDISKNKAIQLQLEIEQQIKQAHPQKQLEQQQTTSPPRNKNKLEDNNNNNNNIYNDSCNNNNNNSNHHNNKYKRIDFDNINTNNNNCSNNNNNSDSSSNNRFIQPITPLVNNNNNNNITLYSDSNNNNNNNYEKTPRKFEILMKDGRLLQSDSKSLYDQLKWIEKENLKWISYFPPNTVPLLPRPTFSDPPSFSSK